MFRTQALGRVTHEYSKWWRRLGCDHKYEELATHYLFVYFNGNMSKRGARTRAEMWSTVSPSSYECVWVQLAGLYLLTFWPLGCNTALACCHVVDMVNFPIYTSSRHSSILWNSVSAIFAILSALSLVSISSLKNIWFDVNKLVANFIYVLVDECPVVLHCFVKISF